MSAFLSVPGCVAIVHSHHLWKVAQPSTSLQGGVRICSFAGVWQRVSSKAFWIDFIMIDGRTWPSPLKVKHKSKTLMRFIYRNSSPRHPSVAFTCACVSICWIVETSKLWKLQGAAPKSGVPFARVACVYHCEGGVNKITPPSFGRELLTYVLDLVSHQGLRKKRYLQKTNLATWRATQRNEINKNWQTK